MNSSPDPGYHIQLPLLWAELRQLRIQADLYGSGDTIHDLRSYVANATTALTLVEQRMANRHGTLPLEELLEIAQQSLRDMRAMIIQIRARRFKQG